MSKKQESGFSFKRLRNQGVQFLRSFLSFSGQTIAIQSARSLAQLFEMSLKYLKDEIKKDKKKKFLLKSIDPLRTQLKEAIEEESWDSLTQAITDSLDFLKKQRIYVNGFHIPFLDLFDSQPDHPSTIPDLFDTIDRHRLALNPKANARPSKISHQMIQKQSVLLKEKLAALIPLNCAGKIAGIDVDADLQAEVLKNDSSTSEEDLAILYRKRFFTKIDQSSSWFLRRWLGKLLYYPLQVFSAFYIRSVMQNLTDESLSLIKTDPKKPDIKRKWVIDTLRGSLATLSGAYTQVGNMSGDEIQDIDLMMEEVLKTPKRNGGLSEEALFKAGMQTLLDAFGPKITWSQSIDDTFSKEIPSTSLLRFLNPIAQSAQFSARWTLKIFILLPQGVGNLFLWTLGKLAVRYSPSLQTYAKEKLEEMQENTPASFAMQKMIYRQMRDLLELTQKRLKAKKKHPNLGEKIKISGLVHHTLDVLEKGACRTQDQLKKLLEEKGSWRDWFNRQAENNARPEIVENAIAPISIALGSLTKESQLKRMLHDSLCLANESFGKQKKVSNSDFVSVQEALLDVTDKMIETVVRDAVEEKLDFTNEKQLEGLQKYIGKFKKRTENFCESLKRTSQKVSADKDLKTTELREKIATLLEKSIQFQKESIDALGGAYDENSTLDLSVVKELNGMQKELNKKLSQLTKKLNAMQKKADRMGHSHEIRTRIRSAIKRIAFVDEKFQKENLSKQGILSCTSTLKELKKISGQLGENRSTETCSKKINLYCDAMKTRLKRIQSRQSSNQTLDGLSRLIPGLPRGKSEQEKHFMEQTGNLSSVNQQNTVKDFLFKYVSDQIDQIEFSNQIDKLSEKNHETCKKIKMDQTKQVKALNKRLKKMRA